MRNWKVMIITGTTYYCNVRSEGAVEALNKALDFVHKEYGVAPERIKGTTVTETHEVIIS